MKTIRPISGFTLLELAIVLLVIGLFMAGAFATLTASVKSTQTNSTVATMQAIDTAIKNYVNAYGRLPCPGSLTLLPSDANYGKEAANPGTCTGGTPAANFTNSVSTVAEGAVPTRALGLPDSFMYDGWGRHLRYAVWRRLTLSASSTPSIDRPLFSPIGGLCSPVTNGITVNDASGASRVAQTGQVTGQAVYALLSHGENGYGAYTQQGQQLSSGSSANETTNTHAAGFTATFVQKAAAYDSGHQTGSAADTQYYFDDIVSYKTAWQLVDANSTPAACLFAVDQGNNRVQAFDKNGNYIYSFGSYNAGKGGLAKPYALIIDTTGYFWVSESDNNRVEKLTFAGVSISQPVSMGGEGGTAVFIPNGCANNNVPPACNSSVAAGNFQTPGPRGIALSNTTNFIYAVNPTLGKYQRFTLPSGAYDTVTTMTGPSTNITSLALVPSGTPMYMADITNNTVYSVNLTTATAYASGTPTNLTLAVSAPQGVALDSSNNVWVADTGNHRVFKMSASNTAAAIGTDYAIGGGYPSDTASPKITKGTSGSAAGQFNTPTSLVIDPSGNVWVADSGNSRLQQFDQSGTFLRSIGSAGTGPGQFNSSTTVPITLTYSSRN